MPTIDIKFSPPDLLRRMSAFPDKLDKTMNKYMLMALLKIQENVEEYPTEPPGSSYDRTGTLGRSLGLHMVGKPDIFESKKLGQGGYIGIFGTKVKYAKYVIGVPADQAWMHEGRWWRIDQLKDKSESKVKEVFQKLVNLMIEFLEGRGA